MNEVYEKVRLDDLRTSLAMIMGIQNAKLDDPGVISAALGGGILTWRLQQFVRDRVEEVS
jgi:hypothetical protein